MSRNGFRHWGWLGVLVLGLMVGHTSFADTAAKGAVYRWVDETGAVHFGDRPPEEAAGLAPVELEPNVVELPVPDLSRTPARGASPPRTAPAATPSPDADKRCAGYRLQLKHLRARMRQGYSASDSNRLHDQQRRLKERIALHC